jgi:uncharacterized heparinase superfamily protein
LALEIPDPWPGDLERARRLLAATDLPSWDGADAVAHGFAWLGDLRAAGGDAARQLAQRLVESWIARHGLAPLGAAWAPQLVGERLVHWIRNYAFFGKPAPQSFKTLFFLSMAHQARALARTHRKLADTAACVSALSGLVAFGAAVPGASARLKRALRRLAGLLRAWPASGVVTERNPSAQLAALRHLVDIDSILKTAERALPLSLEGTIARAGRALAALRHGDGGLVLFHGSIEEDPAFVDIVLARARAGAAVPWRFSGGFERAMRGDSLLLFDAAAPPRRSHDRVAHAGTLAFEFSANAARLIVNCGAARGQDAAWRDAGRATPAHSTVVVGEAGSSEIVAGGGLRRRPTDVTVDRQEEGGACWITGSHNGYLRRFGLLHRRRLFLAADGADLRGEDRLAPRSGRKLAERRLGTPFRIHFHLHPSVVVGEPVASAGRGSVVPFRSDRGGAWRLVAGEGLGAAVEDSFYLGAAGLPQKTRRIVLAGRVEAESGADARWAIQREG